VAPGGYLEVSRSCLGKRINPFGLPRNFWRRDRLHPLVELGTRQENATPAGPTLEAYVGADSDDLPLEAPTRVHLAQTDDAAKPQLGSHGRPSV
jgi:hypothetical protein